MKKRRIIIGMTGASGAIYGLRLIEVLHGHKEIETHLVISTTAKALLAEEVDAGAGERIMGLAGRYYENFDLAAPIASGSYITEGMFIAPCSAKTLAAVAHGFGDTLISRAADVVLKERRKLILLLRETPLHLIHIENMARVTRSGGIILPPVPAFYHRPETIDDLVNHSIGRALDLAGIEHSLYKRWGS